MTFLFAEGLEGRSVPTVPFDKHELYKHVNFVGIASPPRKRRFEAVEHGDLA